MIAACMQVDGAPEAAADVSTAVLRRRSVLPVSVPPSVDVSFLS